MNPRNIIIGIVALAIVSVGGFYAWTQYGPGANTVAIEGLPAPIDNPLAQAQPDDMVLGDANAPITMIEYASLSCPHCAKFQATVLPEIKKAYVDTGKVKLVLRDFPLNRPAVEAALLAYCVSPMAFWGMVDQLFATQANWVNENSTPALSVIAAAAGINGQDFNTCLNDTVRKDKLVASIQQAGDVFKVNSTPTFVINGIVVQGGESYERFAKIFDSLGAK